MADATDALLAERAQTHGNYITTTQIIQAIKDAIRLNPDAPFHKLDAAQRESIEMIANKMGRIISGDPNFVDHWDDIAGYARLAAEHIRSQTKAP